MTEWNRGSSQHSISSKLYWRVGNGRTEVCVREADADTQRNALLDALHLWNVEADFQGAVKLRLQDPSDAVCEEIGTMLAALRTDVDVSVTPQPKQPPDFQKIARKWARLLKRRDRALASLPPLAERLQREVNDNSFYWTKTLYGRITGRIDGLKVCEILNDWSAIMRIGQSEKAKALFEEITGESELAMSDATAVRDVQVLRQLVASRRNGPLNEIQREHLLEARVLRKDISVRSPSKRVMTPAIRSGQFPTRWAMSGKARYLDALMRDGAEPWAIELKIRSGGAGQYLRHGVGQAILYRAFIKAADPIHPYLMDIGVEPATCKAAVAFPALTGRDAASRTDEVVALAKLFDISVLELDAPGF